MRLPRSEVRAVRMIACRADGPGGEPWGGRRGPRHARQRCTPALGRQGLSAALARERRFRPRLLCDFRDPRCAPCGSLRAAPMGRAASLGAAGGARGTPGSAALRHLGARGYLRHWNGDSGRGYYATSAIRGARRAAQCVPRRWAGRRALGRPAGPAARPAALYSGTWAPGAICSAHSNGDSGRGYYVTSAIRGARRAAHGTPRRGAGRRGLGRPAGPAARPAALHSGTWAPAAICGAGTAIPAEVAM